MKNPGYREAINWLAGNDDCHWLGDYDAHGSMISVTAAMVRDLWDVSDDKLIKDIKIVLRKIYPDHKAL